MPNWNPVADKVNRGCRLPADFPLEAYGSGSATRRRSTAGQLGSFHPRTSTRPAVGKRGGLARIDLSGLRQRCRNRPDFLGTGAHSDLQRARNSAQRRFAHPGHPRHSEYRRDLLGSGKKLAEHGDFAHDDTNVMMLLSNPSFDRKRITSPVGTMQIAPTILQGSRPRSGRSGRRETGRHGSSAGPRFRRRRTRTISCPIARWAFRERSRFGSAPLLFSYLARDGWVFGVAKGSGRRL